MNLIQIFKKYNGVKHIKQYYQSGTLFTAIAEFFLLGKSRTALEILRLSVTLKTKQKLYKKYRYKLDEFDKSYCEKQHISSNIIWTCWFQGLEAAPPIVKICYQSIVKNNPNKTVILVTSDNLSKYVNFPDFIIKKWSDGKITYTHMTDLLRLELLTKYGGMWVDATVFCSSQNIPNYFFDSDLFFYQCLKPGRDGHASYISSWLISAKSNNKILLATKELCYEYWKSQDFLLDYYLLHDFVSIVLDRYEDEWKKIVPRDNSTPHILLLKFFDEYEENLFNYITEQTPFHKLSYKFTDNQIKKSGTFYDIITRSN